MRNVKTQFHQFCAFLLISLVDLLSGLNFPTKKVQISEWCFVLFELCSCKQSCLSVTKFKPSWVKSYVCLSRVPWIRHWWVKNNVKKALNPHWVWNCMNGMFWSRILNCHFGSSSGPKPYSPSPFSSFSRIPTFTAADAGGPPCPKDFFKIMQFSGNFKGKAPILSKFWAQPPPSLGSKLPVDQNPGSAPDVHKYLCGDKWTLAFCVFCPSRWFRPRPGNLVSAW